MRHPATPVSDAADHARQTLRAGVTSLRLLAWTSAGLGVIAAAPLTFGLISGYTKPGPGHIIYFLACALVGLAPALFYFVLSVALLRRAPWSPIAAIVVATMHGACAIVGAGLITVLMIKEGKPVGALLIAIALAVIALCVYAIMRVWHAIKVMNLIVGDSAKAFEPIT